MHPLICSIAKEGSPLMSDFLDSLARYFNCSEAPCPLLPNLIAHIESFLWPIVLFFRSLMRLDQLIVETMGELAIVFLQGLVTDIRQRG